MKKSRIIVPALAMLTLSVAASVTGTVAWFTASRTATIKATNVAVINTAGALSCSLTQGIGTKVSGTTVTLSPMMDASVNSNGAITDVTAGTGVDVYTANFNSESHITGLAKREASYHVTMKKEGSTNVDIYALNSWKMTFSSTSTVTNHLYFDTRAAKSKINEGITDAEVYKSLRVYLAAGNNKIVWAPYTDETKLYTAVKSGNVATAINPTDVFNSESYGDLVAETVNGRTSFDEGYVYDGANSSIVNAYSHALLSNSIKDGSPVEVSCMIWFEGLDSSCKGSSGVSTVSNMINKTLDLSFYTVDPSTLLS